MVVEAQGISLAKGERSHGVAVHTNRPAGASQVAIGLLLGDQKIEPVCHRGGELAILVGVPRSQVGQEGQTGHRRIGVPVHRFSKTGLSRRTVYGEIIVALHCRSVLVPRGSAVPAAVGVLMTSQPIQRRSTACSLAILAPLRWARTVRLASSRER